MIIWLNGPFGAGKTTVTAAMLRAHPDLVEFDTELLGYALRPALSRVQPVEDFQEWPAWRNLVITALTDISLAIDRDVVVPQSVLVEGIWDEIAGALSDRAVDVVAVTLHVDPDEHLARIERDMLARPASDAGRLPAAAWRRARRRDYDAALPWLHERTQVIDTTNASPDETVRLVGRAVNERAAR